MNTYKYMPNSAYVKGRKKEYMIVSTLKKQGYDIAQRTAGSHSPIDVFAIDKKKKRIVFIQSKPDNYPESKGKKIKQALNYLNNTYEVRFYLI